MTRSPFVVTIAELRRERARPKPVEIDEAVDWQLDLARILPDPPLRAQLTLEPVNGGIMVEGSVEAAVRHTCHRCLDEWTGEVAAHVAQLFVAADGEDVDYEIDGPAIDLEPLIRDEVLLALPLVPTCPEGCAGVVDGTKSGLNTPTPDDIGDSSSPFAVLKDLLEAGE